MQVFIIEDNEIELESLKILLEEFKDIQLIGTALTLESGIEQANREHPDLIFLDIQLECKNSLQHLHKLNFSPVIICCTLYDEHALQAFEVGVTDYLTKPITHEKLNRALQRLPEKIPSSTKHPAQTISLKRGRTLHRVPLEDILYITSDRDYTCVQVMNGTEFICSRRMREWSGLLPANLFTSLDRSTLINRKQIASFSLSGPDHPAKITFQNNHTLEIGLTAQHRLKSIMN